MGIESLVAVLIATGFAVMSWYNLQIERKRSVAREQELLSAIMSKNVQEYLEAVEGLKTSPAEKLALIRADNELALNAANFEKRVGIPIS